MELICLSGVDVGGMFGRHSQWLTDDKKTVFLRVAGLRIGGCVA